MTPKQRYDERKRRREEQRRRWHEDAARDAKMEEMVEDLTNSLGRIADVLELWAEQQG